MSTFIDLHILQTLPPSNVNRDDSGSPKTCVYGGVRRARVSSQAWKRATRVAFSQRLDTAELGERTVFAVERIAKRITDLRPDLADEAEQLAAAVLKKAGVKSEKNKPKDENETPRTVTGYLLFISRGQIDALARLAVDNSEHIAKTPAKDAKAAMTGIASIDLALFGRMVADAPDLNMDAACQVAHALSVHSTAQEFDYFTAVDDNAPEDNAGATMIGTVEFSAPTLYRYATINADELANNLGSVDAAARAVEAFVDAFITSMPTGKQNTFANRTLPDFVLVQVRDDQPVNLAEAFEDSIEDTRGRTTAATKALAQYAAELEEAYTSRPVASAFLAAGGAAKPEALEALKDMGERVNLAGLVELAGSQVRERVEAQ
ncbi:CRISPR system Cascade subunit CasC [Corynebacterium spheniscorum]|uniref:CRISPR system Cascade subunit CasC n=2 Tax=Corynebacterium spheniscorum TaxID=185761 RepID=A0A1I2QHV6_9CORY|nr:type I-E CRISPR-associated protein Cas7/Cse4/CasC [Corynebacterium spheniscorum]SFG25316.1 CRISPR system Cascade subunit CasC [Corynebacterium spheniscorum]